MVDTYAILIIDNSTLDIRWFYMTVSEEVRDCTRLPDGRWAKGANGRATREQRFLDAVWLKLDEPCPYDILHRTYFDYLVAQAVEDATDSNPKYRIAAREWITNRLMGLPRATLDTNLSIEAHINADALEMALRPIMEAQKAMIAQYRESSVDTTYTLLPNDVVQSSVDHNNDSLASKQ